MKNSTSLRILSMSVLMALMVFSLSTQQARAQIPAPSSFQFDYDPLSGYTSWDYNYGALMDAVGVVDGGYFEYWRSTDGGSTYEFYEETGQYLDTNPDNTSQHFNDSLSDSVPAGETYYYKVKLVCQAGDSDLSESTISLSGPSIPAPGNFQFDYDPSAGYTSWNYSYGALVDAVGVVDGGYFEYWRSTDGGNTYEFYEETGQYLDTNPDNTSQYFNDSLSDSVPAGETYYYKVKLVCQAGDSDLSSSYVAITGQ